MVFHLLAEMTIFLTSRRHWRYQCGVQVPRQRVLQPGPVDQVQERQAVLYEVLNKQAQIILNLDGLSSAGALDVQLTKQTEYGNLAEACLEQKQRLYERFLLKEISLEDFQTQGAVIDAELNRLKQLHSVLKTQTEQMQMDEKAKRARTELAREVAGASGLTADLVNALIDRVYVYPDNQVNIIWKMKDFCLEEP